MVRTDGQEAATDREKLTAQIKKLEAEKSKPDLLGKIHHTMAFDEGGQLPATGVLITISILNRGAPSIAQNYSAIAIINGVRREAELWYIFDGTELTMSDGTELRLDRSDAIYEKTTNRRIETGAQAWGSLRLRINGTKREEFFRMGNAVEVSFEDSQGTCYVATHVFKNGGDPMMYYPGGPRPAGGQPGTPQSGKARRQK